MATDPKTIASYNKHAEKYDQQFLDPDQSIFHSYYEKPAIRAQLPSLTGLSVISIGCGSGLDARFLHDNGVSHVVGVDISEGMIEVAKRNHPDLDFHIMDMEQLNFPDESFHLAYSSLAIEYVDDWTKPLKEAYRVLKPEGKYIFSCGHPIESAMERFEDERTRGARMGRTIIRDTGERIVYGDYLAAKGDGTKPIDVTKLGDMELRIYHRTFSKMLEQILASGFSIERLVEPQPTKDMLRVDPGMFEQLTRMPLFMVWVLRK